MTGDLFINGRDAYETWGLCMTDASMGQLRTPPALKEMVSNTSRLLHGTQYVESQTVKIAERRLTLTIFFTAKTEQEFNTKYESFVAELKTGKINITTHHQPTVEYKTRYLSCNQYTEFMQGIAKFVLNLTEPDPSDRELNLN